MQNSRGVRSGGLRPGGNRSHVAPSVQPQLPDLTSIDNEVCPSCGSELVMPLSHVKRISLLQSPDGQEHMVLIPAGLYCFDCKKCLIDETGKIPVSPVSDSEISSEG